MTDATPEHDDAAMAAEYALRLLSVDERRAFEARLREEPALGLLVRDWDERLAPLAGEIVPVAPPGSAKPAVETRLFGSPERSRFARLGWRVGGGVLAALALVLAVLVFLPELAPDADRPVYLAEVAAEDRSLLVRARYDPGRGAVEIETLAGAAPPGRVLELWLIAEGADAPVSLGVLPDDGVGSLPLSAELGGRMAGGVLAITDEPPGGSPTGLPTGAVHATGEIMLL